MKAKNLIIASILLGAVACLGGVPIGEIGRNEEVLVGGKCWGDVDQSINLGSLVGAQTSFADTDEPFTILTIGDSYARTYSSAPNSLYTKLKADRDFAGVGVNTMFNENNATLGGSASKHNIPNTTGGTVFPFGYYEIGATTNDSVTFAAFDTDGYYADTIGLYYVKQPNGGNFTVDYRVAGGAWVNLGTVNGYAATAGVHYQEYSVPAAAIEARVVGDAGTNYPIGFTFINSESKGVRLFNFSAGGWNCGDSSDAYTSTFWGGIFNNVDPDLILFVDEGDRTDDYDAYIGGSGLETAINAANCPVAVQGVFPHQSSDQTFAAGVQYEMCATNGWAFIDTYYETRSVDWLLSKGYLTGSDIHLTESGGSYVGDVLYNKIFKSETRDGGYTVKYFPAHTFCSEAGMGGDAGGYDTHLYTWTGNDVDVYRWWGVSVASNNTYRSWSTPISVAEFGEGKKFTNAKIRLKLLTKEQTSVSFAFSLKLWDPGMDPTTEAKQVLGGTSWGYGPVNYGEDGQYTLVNTEWKTFDISSYDVRDNLGYLNFGNGSIANSQEYLILGIELGLK